ncbi:response regulator transcription factor [Pseudactinotalea sp. Z1739]|uniref:response regulator transcription factor n=1 Tax=Pseudactinotalea sp. Z1739 TaxID=3413028 RepID=UPI003C79D25B
MIRVLLADDQTLVREGLRMILDAQEDIEVVGEAATGAEAVRQARLLAPDVVLMDIRMPEMDGLEASRRILGSPHQGTPKVLVLTTFDLNEYVYMAMKAGASGFILKDAPRRQLIEAVRIVAEGDALLAPAITRRLIEEFVTRQPPTSGVPPQFETLTERELDVFRLIARGHNNQEIAEKLYLGRATIKTHIGHLLTKLDLRDRAQLIVLAYETGLIQPGDTN